MFNLLFLEIPCTIILLIGGRGTCAHFSVINYSGKFDKLYMLGRIQLAKRLKNDSP